MKLNIKYRDDPTGFPGVESNWVSDDIDGMRLLLMALLSESSYRLFYDAVIENGRSWDCDSFNIAVNNRLVTITPAYDSTAVWELPLNILISILKDWREFVAERSPFTKEYLW